MQCHINLLITTLINNINTTIQVLNGTNYIIWNVKYYNKYEFSQKLSPYNFTWKSSSTSMTFQNITIAKPSHLYLAAKPYLDPATASINPYLAA